MFLKSLLKDASKHGKSELNRIDYLDGWRGLAILFVLISHFMQPQIGEFGRLGVDIFFVLSGMLMSNILFVKRVPLNTFYKRRISRILPVFVIFVSSIYLSAFLFDLSNEYDNYFYTLAFLRSYLPTDVSLWETGLPIGHLWSLNVEEHCYVLLSLLTLISVLRSREYIAILMIGMGCIVLHIIYVKYPTIAPTNYELKTEVAASHLMLSAGYFLIRDRFAAYVPSWLPLLTFFAAMACYEVDAPWFAYWLISPFLLAFTVNHLDKIPALAKKALEINALRLLGMWSYSIYLWQQVFYFYGIKNGNPSTFLAITLFAVSIFVGALSFHIIENPIRKYLNNKW
ncbi:acyltransferase family protein [Flocculibacter collagenilyticus]|uniref:acyltransferase family protein n=1 Tax=Flocculibacter collagenilyticus TaxID=2744479 RepID=UPI0018F6321A|nr:acyltransferase [Flocculibacter collagenilyticus]